MRTLAFFLLAAMASGDALTDKMTARVSEEAAAFVKIAPEVLGTETLHQRQLKAPSRFHPRIGDAATKPPMDQWKERTLVSEYGFTVFSQNAGAVHELRQVTQVDGKKVGESKKAEDSLAKAIMGSDDARKRAMLDAFAKQGLDGAVTDFGQLLLLFSRRDLERFEFTTRPSTMIGYERALVWSYKQVDGPESLTLFESSKLRHLKIGGEIRVRASDFVPLQITLITQEGDLPNAVREEAAVTYEQTKFGVLLPVTTEHRELRNGKLVMENHFTYSNFHKFGASSDLSFPKE